MKDPVNFLPWRRTRFLRRLRGWAICVCAVWLACGVVAWAASAHWQGERRVHEIHKQMEHQMTQQLAGRVKLLNAQVAQNAQFRQRQAHRQKTQAWSSQLTQLADKLPAQAWLKALSYRDGVLALSGTIAQFAALNTMDDSMQSVPGFARGKAEKIQRDSAGYWMFEYRLREDAGHENP